MNPENYLEVLRALIALAVEYRFRRDVRSKGTQAYEPAYFAVLMYVKRSPPQLQKLAELEFTSKIKPHGHAHELVGYCMRDLKFPLVKEAVQHLHNSIENRGPGFQNRRILEDILRAYEPEWAKDRYYAYHESKIIGERTTWGRVKR